MRGRLNLFQATMLRWRELHPYNAVHAVRVDAPLDAERLARTVNGVLEARGLAGLVLDPARGRYEYAGGAARVALEILPGDNDPVRVLEAAIERGVNLRFAPAGPLDPFRFFAVDAGAAHYLGVAYDHVVAGGDSIVDLLAEIVLRDAGATLPARAAPSLYPPTCSRLFARHGLALLRGLAAMPGAIASLRRSQRPRYRYGDDQRNAFASATIGAEGVAAMRRAAAAWGVTRADLLLALLLRALAPVVGREGDGRRRREIGVATIVNLRRDFGTPVGATFGQFLSSYRYAHRVPEGARLESLARDLHVETARVRRRKLYLVTLLALAGVGALWRWLTPRRRARVYSKHYAAWAGLTPLDVDALWREAGAGHPPAAYLRAVSTGPATPLVVAASSAGNELHLGLSYRTAAFHPDDIVRILTALKAGVQELDA
ncbi:MAG TPA: hypothetical protein VET86_15755 [Casimicrobiaceae bacterium]|nr:hypothetical protein [Casimicrobiaceae bacterium]